MPSPQHDVLKGIGRCFSSEISSRYKWDFYEQTWLQFLVPSIVTVQCQTQEVLPNSDFCPAAQGGSGGPVLVLSRVLRLVV